MRIQYNFRIHTCYNNYIETNSYMINSKSPTTAATMVVITVIMFYLANSKGVFGKIVNLFFPCEQDPTTSFPCYMGVDITVMIISVVIGVIFLGILILHFSNR